jgi:glycosyltransferase involved in cell wall biosynthesis
MLKLACIPAFNVQEQISDVITKSLKIVDRVIVCDDGSTDQTSEFAKNSGATVLKHDKNLGKGEALKTLFEYAKKLDADIIVTIDGDGQFLPEEMEFLIEPISNSNFDIVIGNRFSKLEEMPQYRKIGNKMLDKFTKIAADLPFSDSQSGFRSYSKNAIHEIKFTSKGFGVDSEILIDAFHKELKITERNVTVLYDTGYKTSTKNPVSHTMTVIGTIIESIAIHHPLKYLGIPGILLLMIGLYFAINAIMIFSESGDFSLPSVLISTGTLIFGLLMLLMSVVLYSLSYQRKN